jgi:hypothetical protein
LNKDLAKIQLGLKILELKEDGLIAEHAGEHDDGEGSVRQKITNAYRTAPAYVKQKVHSQRNSLDVLLQSTKQTLELMELLFLTYCLSQQQIAQKSSTRVQISSSTQRCIHA